MSEIFFRYLVAILFLVSIGIWTINMDFQVEISLKLNNTKCSLGKNKSIIENNEVAVFVKIKAHSPYTDCNRANLELKEKLVVDSNLPGELDSVFRFNLNISAAAGQIDAHKVRQLLQVKPGGQWSPNDCRPGHRVAIIIPYRDRERNLAVFLYNMHPFLQRQLINYTIFVVEQANSFHFNKGLLMNAAFREILLNKNTLEGVTRSEFDCVIFHDVDMLPTDELNSYTCPEKRPRHLSVLVDQYDYRKLYPILVGGVMVFKKWHFIHVNGYSNNYWGWGAEDDDMYYRLESSGLYFDRPAKNTRYTMLKHDSRWINPKRFDILASNKNKYKSDGLSTVKYNLVGFVKYSLFTHISVDIDRPSQL